MSAPRIDLSAYLAAQDRKRAEGAAEKWDALSEREQRLVREAAVLSFVRGTMHGQRAIPKDSAIVQQMLTDVPMFAHLYPTLAALGLNTEGASDAAL